jgi:preprotein translocase subunit SecD
LISICRANEIVVVISSATAGHDERTGKPVLNLSFKEVSEERLRSFSADNLGQMVEFRVDGRVVLRTIIREPLSVRAQVNDPGWTDQAVIEPLRRFSEAPKGEIELQRSPSSN